jgi:hypothetical protein
MSLVPKDWSKEIRKIELKNKAKLPQNQDPSLAVLSRPVQKTSRYYFNQYRKIWGWLFATLPFDFLMLLALPLLNLNLLDDLALESSSYILLTLSGLSLFWFVKDFIISRLALLDDLKGNIFTRLNDKPWLIFVILGFFIVIELLSKTANANIFYALAVAVGIFLMSAKSVREQIKQKASEHKLYQNDLTLQVELFNKTVFMLHLLPLISTRLVILLSCLIVPLAFRIDLYLFLFISFGCVMLSLMQAEEKLFMFSCSRCGVPTSRFLGKHRQCLACLSKV